MYPTRRSINTGWASALILAGVLCHGCSDDTQGVPSPDGSSDQHVIDLTVPDSKADTSLDRAVDTGADLQLDAASQDLALPPDTAPDLPLPADLPIADLTPAPDTAPDLPLPPDMTPDLPPAPDMTPDLPPAPDQALPDALQPDFCPTVCAQDSQCDDKDPCTTDKCVAGCCQSGWSKPGTVCADKTLCTVKDVCDGKGGCAGQGCDTLDTWLSLYQCSGQSIQRSHRDFSCSATGCTSADAWKTQATCPGTCSKWCNTGKAVCGKAPSGAKVTGWSCTCDGLGACTTTVTVNGTANIYGAGHKTPPAPGGGGVGALPTELQLPPGKGRVLRLTVVSGTVKYGTGLPANGADGKLNTTSCSWTNLGGLSGPTVFTSRFMGGVFIDDNEPKDPPPAKLSIPSPGFTTLSPGLRQTFFLGDGLTGTGSGTVQQFAIPDGATRAYMGFHDSSVCGGQICCYSDNSGKLTVTLSITTP